ncbi:MAG: hypothetical protein GY906_13645 [bacterium]|nr:hypothetical protein [bacterium]
MVVWNTVITDAARPLQAVQGQRFNSDGTPAGEEFRVDILPGDWGRNADIGMDSEGYSVVAWEGGSPDQVGRRSIWARRFDPSGKPLGREIHVNQRHTPGNYHAVPEERSDGPKVTLAADGGFLVVWTDHGSGVCNRSDVIARSFDAKGIPLGNEVIVNHGTRHAQLEPTVARESGGSFIVVWCSISNAGGPDEASSLKGRRLSPSGEPSSPEIVLVASDHNSIRHPSIASLSNGQLGLSWLLRRPSGEAGIQRTVLALRVFNRDGTPATGPPVKVAEPEILDATIHSLSNGNMVAVWSQWEHLGFTGATVFGQTFDSNAKALGNPLQLSPQTTKNKRHASAAIGHSGELLTVWESSRSSNIQGTRMTITDPISEQKTQSMGPTLHDLSLRATEILRRNFSAVDRAAAADDLATMPRVAGVAVPPLTTALSTDDDPRVRQAAATALAAVTHNPSDAAPVLLDALKDSSPEVRFAAAESLSRLGYVAGDKELLSMVQPIGPISSKAPASERRGIKESAALSPRAAVALGRNQVPGAEAVLLEALEQARFPQLRFGIIIGFTWLKNPSNAVRLAIGTLLENKVNPSRSYSRVHDVQSRPEDDHSVDLALLIALRRFGTRASNQIPQVQKMAKDDNPTVRAAALRTLPLIGGIGSISSTVAAEALNHPSPSVRFAAIEALSRMRTDALLNVIETLHSAVRDSDTRVRHYAGIVVQRLDDERCAVEPLTTPTPPPANGPEASSPVPRGAVGRKLSERGLFD